MSKLLRVELSKKINLAIPAFHNYQEIKTLNAPLITNGLNEFVQFRLPSWKINKNSIERLYEFENFKKAFGFMTEVAHVAEYIDHHPEWSNVYNKINVRLLSHYCNGVTLKDLFLAFSMEKLSENVKDYDLPQGKIFEKEFEVKKILKEWNE